MPNVSFGDKAARGFFYALAQFGGVKLVTILGQYILSWLLKGEDFGYVGLTFAVSGFGALIAAAGLRDVLIRRWSEYDRWATPAFWMSATFGTCSTLVTWAIAPLAAWYFRDARLTPLIIILACQTAFGSFSLLPDARLTIDLRFKLLAAVNFGTSTLVIALSVLFAALGFRAYSLILPWPIATAIRTAILWLAAPARVHLRPHLRLWRHLAGDSTLLAVAALFVLIVSQFDYVILGRMYTDKAVIGHYFWAFNLSMQAMQLLALNLGAVLLPSLARLQHDPQRQLSGFLRAGKALMVVVVPACLFQAALADPLIRLTFSSEWYPAIPIVAILSSGWILMGVNWPALNALKAQGRFGTVTWYMAMSSVVFLAAVYFGAKAAAGIGAACGVAVYSTLCGPLGVYLAIRSQGGTWRDTRNMLLSPVAAGLTAFGIASLLAWLIPSGPLQNVLRIGVVLTIAGPIYYAIMHAVARPAVEEIRGRLKGLLTRRPAPAHQATG